VIGRPGVGAEPPLPAGADLEPNQREPILKMTQTTMDRMLQSDFSRYEVLSGLPHRMVVRHALRNCCLPRYDISVLYGYLLGGPSGGDRLQLGRRHTGPGRAQFRHLSVWLVLFSRYSRSSSIDRHIVYVAIDPRSDADVLKLSDPSSDAASSGARPTFDVRG